MHAVLLCQSSCNFTSHWHVVHLPYAMHLPPAARHWRALQVPGAGLVPADLQRGKLCGGASSWVQRRQGRMALLLGHMKAQHVRAAELSCQAVCRACSHPVAAGRVVVAMMALVAYHVPSGHLRLAKTRCHQPGGTGRPAARRARGRPQRVGGAQPGGGLLAHGAGGGGADNRCVCCRWDSDGATAMLQVLQHLLLCSS